MIMMLLSTILSAQLLQAHGDWVHDTMAMVHQPDKHPKILKSWDSFDSVWNDIMRAHAPNNSLHLPCVSYPEVRMSDGTLISTTLVNPWPCDKKKGAMLVRSPYGPSSNRLALVHLVLNGFAAVMQEQRGTVSSGGTFNMWLQDGQDGREAMQWITGQPWSNGDVYTAGLSADGVSTLTPENVGGLPVKGQWSIYFPGDGHGFVFPQGAYRYDIFEGYMNFISEFTRNASRDIVIPEIRRNEAFSPWWYNLTACHNGSTHLKPLPPCNYKFTQWPVVQNAGWWDIFQKTQLQDYEGIRSASDPAIRDKHVLIVDPLGHCIGGLQGTAGRIGSRFALETNRALAVGAEVASEFFAGKFDGPVRSKIGHINFFVMSNYGGDSFGIGNFWTSVEQWPVPAMRSFHLQSDHSLAAAAGHENWAIRYTYDPSQKSGLAPMLGGNNLPLVGGIKHCGSADQSEREQRDDVIVFDSGALRSDVPIVGQIKAKLFVSSSANDTDFVVTVSDVYKNKSMLVRFGAMRMRWKTSLEQQDPPMEAGQVYEVDIDLAETAYIFARGHTIRVAISSAAFPYYDANPNTGSPLSAVSTPMPAENTIHMGAQYPSRVLLPVVSLRDIPRNPHFGPIRPVPHKPDAEPLVIV
jgi:hypothetical protein